MSLLPTMASNTVSVDANKPPGLEKRKVGSPITASCYEDAPPWYMSVHASWIASLIQIFLYTLGLRPLPSEENQVRCEKADLLALHDLRIGMYFHAVH